jgi:transcriptional regulator with XRE-family HTH domain
MAFLFQEDTMNRLREARVLKRITQFQLRLSTGIHQSKISMIENGFIEPRSDERQRLAKALGVKQEEIFPNS